MRVTATARRRAVRRRCVASAAFPTQTSHARRSCAHEAPAEGLAVQEKDDDAEDDGSVLSSLLDEMRPYVLRRVKAHVEKSVPPKEEIVVSVALAPLQKRYYRALYEKNVPMLAGTGRPVRSRRPVVLWCLHFVDVTRLRE